MPLPRRLAEFNKHFTNRALMPLAGWAPGFAIIHHIGRRTGRQYRTPVNLFRRGDGYLFALTYGGGSWVENVIAADGCTMETRGEMIKLTHPHRYTDPTLAGIPPPARWLLQLIDVDELLFLTAA